MRVFDPAPPDAALLDELVDYVSGLEVLQSGIDWNFDLLPYEDMLAFLGSEPSPKAPFYLVLRAGRLNFSLQNMGYIGELACLYLTGRGVGTRFIGGLSPQNEFEDVLPYVVTVAVGMPGEPFRDPSQTPDRKPLSKLVVGNTAGDLETILECARRAPSAFNKQPVSYMSIDGRLHVFRRMVPLKWPPTSFVQCIDAGAAIANITAGASALGYDTGVLRLKPEPKWGNRIYQATIQLSKPV